MTKTLHFTLGPVQSFVEQARRTRDLWAGSFLLSYLSGQAMKAVFEAGGTITFPDVGTKENPADELLKAIMGEPHNNPKIGSLPNRFKASVPDDFDPKHCEQAVRGAWKKVADAVWYKYVFHIAEHGIDTQTIWDRQLEAFWDMTWVMGDSDDANENGTWLDRRKNWRTHIPPEEGGDHCTLMGDWQELSGFIRSKEKHEQKKFWNALREQKDERKNRRLSTLELGEHERLSAVALIKRLYPKVKAIGWNLDVENWPSTPYMAAVPWLETAHRTDEAKKYLQVVENAKLEWAFGKYNTGLTCLKNAGKFAELDGNFFQQAALENKNATPLKPELSEPEDEALRRELAAELRKVNKAVGHPASTFYALLLMDGDSLGKLLREADETEVSRALSRFTNQVDTIVREYCGKTVYAGGDDVMALLPLDKALAAANKLRKAYLEAFEKVALPPGHQATISGAVIFAHYTLSLRAVLKEAHHQLDSVAKAQNERDSLAVSVFTGSGRTVQWVSSWHDVEHNFSVTNVLHDLSQRFGDDEQFSSKFFYNLRERLGVLVNEKTNKFEFDMEHADFWFLKAEYQKNRQGAADSQTAERNVHDLLKVCRVRKQGKADEQTLVPDGALLVRFLAGKGRGVER